MTYFLDNTFPPQLAKILAILGVDPAHLRDGKRVKRGGSLVSVAPIVNTLHEDEPAILVEFENSAIFHGGAGRAPRFSAQAF